MASAKLKIKKTLLRHSTNEILVLNPRGSHYTHLHGISMAVVKISLKKAVFILGTFFSW
jgi:hypothetical protein